MFFFWFYLICFFLPGSYSTCNTVGDSTDFVRIARMKQIEGWYEEKEVRENVRKTNNKNKINGMEKDKE